MIEIEVGKVYKRYGSPEEIKICGKARNLAGEPYDGIFWASDGNWYDRNGRFVFVGVAGDANTVDNNWRNLVEHLKLGND